MVDFVIDQIVLDTGGKENKNCTIPGLFSNTRFSSNFWLERKPVVRECGDFLITLEIIMGFLHYNDCIHS